MTLRQVEVWGMGGGNIVRIAAFRMSYCCTPLMSSQAIAILLSRANVVLSVVWCAHD